MDWTTWIDTSRILLFSLVLARVSGIVIMTPVFGTADIPMQFRALFAFSLALLMMPTQWFVEINEPDTLPMYVIVLAAELAIGLALGLGLYIFFSGLEIAGEVMGHVGGMSVAQVFDPTTGENSPLLSRLVYMLGLAVFVCSGGIRLLLAGLLDTFESIPPGGGRIPVELGEALVLILGLSFKLAFQVAAPVMLAALVSMLVIGLLGRTLPQLNLMSIGFSINAMVTFGVLFLSIGGVVYCFQSEILNVFSLILQVLETDVKPEWYEG
jgi:flagellar biosynthetic protein FliR